MKVFVIIPTYNERENIVNLINDIFALGIDGMHVIVVDDNSPDGTAQLVENAKTIFPNLFLIKRLNKLGIGSAYIAGFKKALSLGADFIIEMDADFSHDPKDMPRLIEQCKNGFDLSLGSRKITGGEINGWDFWRKFMSNGAMIMSRIMLGLRAKDVTSGFRCYRKRVLEKIQLNDIKSNGYAFQEEMLYLTQKNGFQIKEVPVIFNDRTKGKSKLSKKDIVEFFITIFKLKFKK